MRTELFAAMNLKDGDSHGFGSEPGNRGALRVEQF